MSPIPILIILLLLIAGFIYLKPTPSQCVLKNWPDDNTGWGQCTPDCNGTQSRLKQQIVSDPKGDCPREKETRSCSCQLVLDNGIVLVNRDYTYQDFINLLGDIQNITIPPNTKLSITTTNSTYVVLGQKITLNILKNINDSTSILSLKIHP